MATLIGSLVLSLGIDATQFVKGTKQLDDSLKKTKEGFKKHGDEVEGSIKGMTSGLGKLSASLIGVFTAISTSRALSDFLGGLAKIDSALGLNAANAGISAKDLRKWQGAVQAP